MPRHEFDASASLFDELSNLRPPAGVDLINPANHLTQPAPLDSLAWSVLILSFVVILQA